MPVLTGNMNEKSDTPVDGTGDVQTNPHCNNLLELNVQPGILYNESLENLQHPPRGVKIYQSQSAVAEL